MSYNTIRGQFDDSQVVPDHQTGNGGVNFVLMSSHSRGTERPAAPQVLVVVKPFGENIDDSRHERRIAAQRFRMGTALAVITNARRWLLFQAPGFQERGHRFPEVDMVVGPKASARYPNRYLSRDSIASGGAVGGKNVTGPDQRGS